MAINQTMERLFLQAYDDYADAIFRHCYFKTSDRDLAKDLTQQTFLQAWAFLKQGKTIEEFRPFLYRLANNLVIDWYRRKKADSLDQLMAEGFNPASENDSPVLIAEFNLAMKFLDKLNPTDKNLIVWRYVEDLSTKEIAVILQTSENTVSVQLHRAVKKVNRLINTN